MASSSVEGSKLPGGYLVTPRVPQGLAAAVEGLTREVIRHTPKDIYVFAAHHFEKLLLIRERCGGEERVANRESNLRTLQEMSQALKARDVDRRSVRTGRNTSDQVGWSLNETAKVLKRHRSIFGEAGRRISTDEVFQMAKQKNNRWRGSEPSTGKNARRHKQETIDETGDDLWKASTSRTERAWSNGESPEVTSETRSGPRIITQIPSLQSSTGLLAKDIKTELRRNRISSRERRNVRAKPDDRSGVDRTDGKSSGRSSGRHGSQRKSSGKQKKIEAELDKRNRRSGNSSDQENSRKPQEARDMDSVKDYVVQRFATTKSLEELQTVNYVKRVQEIIDETSPIIKGKVEELKSGMIGKSKRSSWFTETNNDFSQNPNGLSGEDGDSRGNRRGGNSKDGTTEPGPPPEALRSRLTQTQYLLENLSSKIERPRRSRSARSSRRSVRSNEETLDRKDSGEEATTATIETLTMENGLERKLSRTRNLLENISSTLSRPMRRSSSAKTQRRREDDDLNDLGSKDALKTRLDETRHLLEGISATFATPGHRSAKSRRSKAAGGLVTEDPNLWDSQNASKVSLPAVRSASAKSSSGSVSRSDSDNFVLPAISPEAPKSKRVKEDLVLPVLPPPGTASSNEGSKVSEEIDVFPEEDIPDIPIEEYVPEAVVEDVFRDSLNVTPDFDEIPQRPDSLDPPETADDVEAISKADNLEGRLQEIQQVEKEIERAIDLKTSDDLQQSEILQDSVMKKKLEELEAAEKRIERMLDREACNEGDDASEPEKKVDESVEGGDKSGELTGNVQEGVATGRSTVSESVVKGGQEDEDKEDKRGKDNLTSSSPENLDYTYILTEGSPNEIPDTVTTVIIPDRAVESPESDGLDGVFEEVTERKLSPVCEDVTLKAEEIDVKEIEDTESEVSGKTDPKSTGRESNEDDSSLKKESDPFGELVELEPTESTSPNIDFIREIESRQEMHISHQDLCRINEEELEEGPEERENENKRLEPIIAGKEIKELVTADITRSPGSPIIQEVKEYDEAIEIFEVTEESKEKLTEEAAESPNEPIIQEAEEDEEVKHVEVEKVIDLPEIVEVTEETKEKLREEAAEGPNGPIILEAKEDEEVKHVEVVKVIELPEIVEVTEETEETLREEAAESPNAPIIQEDEEVKHVEVDKVIELPEIVEVTEESKEKLTEEAAESPNGPIISEAEEDEEVKHVEVDKVIELPEMVEVTEETKETLREEAAESPNAPIIQEDEEVKHVEVDKVIELPEIVEVTDESKEKLTEEAAESPNGPIISEAEDDEEVKHVEVDKVIELPEIVEVTEETKEEVTEEVAKGSDSPIIEETEEDHEVQGSEETKKAIGSPDGQIAEEDKKDVDIQKMEEIKEETGSPAAPISKVENENDESHKLGKIDEATNSPDAPITTEEKEDDEVQKLVVDKSKCRTESDLSPEALRPDLYSESSNEAKESSGAEEPLESGKCSNSADEEESSVTRSPESSNEVKETTLTDGLSLSLDPTRPFVPELNLDSLQDISVSSFKMTEDDCDNPARVESGNTNSITETLTSDENRRILENIQVPEEATSEYLTTSTQVGRVEVVEEPILKEQVEAKEDICEKRSAYVTGPSNEEQEVRLEENEDDRKEEIVRAVEEEDKEDKVEQGIVTDRKEVERSAAEKSENEDVLKEEIEELKLVSPVGREKIEDAVTEREGDGSASLEVKKTEEIEERDESPVEKSDSQSASPEAKKKEEESEEVPEESFVEEETPLAVSRSASQCTTRRVSSGNLTKLREDPTLGWTQEAEQETEDDEDGSSSRMKLSKIGGETIREHGSEEIDQSENSGNLKNCDDDTVGTITKDSKEYHIYVPEVDASEDTSTTESSTVDSAVTKIQARVRGFLTRRRLHRGQQNRSSTLSSIPSIQDSSAVESPDLGEQPPRAECTTPDSEGESNVPSAITQDDPGLEHAATRIQSNYRGYKARKRLRREDAVQRTTLSLEKSFADSGLQHTGEFHDCIPLPIHDITLKEKSLNSGSEELERMPRSLASSPLETKEISLEARHDSDSQKDDEKALQERQNHEGMFFGQSSSVPLLQFGIPPNMGHLVDLVVLGKDDAALENSYLNFITSVEDTEAIPSSVGTRFPDGSVSDESLKEPLALSATPVGVVIEEVTNSDVENFLHHQSSELATESLSSARAPCASSEAISESTEGHGDTSEGQAMQDKPQSPRASSRNEGIVVLSAESLREGFEIAESFSLPREKELLGPESSVDSMEHPVVEKEATNEDKCPSSSPSEGAGPSGKSGEVEGLPEEEKVTWQHKDSSSGSEAVKENLKEEEPLGEGKCSSSSSGIGAGVLEERGELAGLPEEGKVTREQKDSPATSEVISNNFKEAKSVGEDKCSSSSPDDSARASGERSEVGGLPGEENIASEQKDSPSSSEVMKQSLYEEEPLMSNVDEGSSTLSFSLKVEDILGLGSEDSAEQHVRKPILQVTLTPGDIMKSMSLSQESQLAGERIESPITMVQMAPASGESLQFEEPSESGHEDEESIEKPIAKLGDK